jgi:hypothetical protein
MEQKPDTKGVLADTTALAATIRSGARRSTTNRSRHQARAEDPAAMEAQPDEH